MIRTTSRLGTEELIVLMDVGTEQYTNLFVTVDVGCWHEVNVLLTLSTLLQ